MSDFRVPDTVWKNGGSECPAYGVFACGNSTVVGSKIILPGTQPSATFSRSYAVNDEFKVAASGHSGAYTHGLCRLLYDIGTPTPNETWGPKPGQWSAAKGYPGFTCLGIVDSEAKIMLARFEPYDTVIGKLTGALGGGTNTVNVWAGAGGSEAVVTGWAISARPWWEPGECYPVSTTSKVTCKNINGQWYIMPMGWDHTAIADYDDEAQQFLTHGVDGCLKWETSEECEE